MCIQPKNLILTNLLSNFDVAQKKVKSDFLAKIVTFEVNFKFLNETTVDSLLFGHVGSVCIFKKYFKRLKNVGSKHLKSNLKNSEKTSSL